MQVIEIKMHLDDWCALYVLVSTSAVVLCLHLSKTETDIQGIFGNMSYVLEDSKSSCLSVKGIDIYLLIVW